MKPKILLIDNVDSFTFNLVQALRSLGASVEVIRADEVELAGMRELDPTHVVLSPGPGRPERAEGSLAVAREFFQRVPVLGVCLGHQCLGVLAGAQVVPALAPRHGETMRVYHDGRAPFRGMPNPFPAGRYHSLTVTEEGLGRDFEVSAWSADGEVLGLRHRRLPVLGVQFHPESLLTPDGERILGSFLALESATELSRAEQESKSFEEVRA